MALLSAAGVAQVQRVLSYGHRVVSDSIRPDIHAQWWPYRWCTDEEAGLLRLVKCELHRSCHIAAPVSFGPTIESESHELPFLCTGRSNE